MPAPEHNGHKQMTLKQKTLIVTVVGMAAIIFSGTAQFWSMDKINSTWEHASQAEMREVLLSDIKAEFGYGGIIHNFKNYVLRGQDKYIGRIAKDSDMLNVTIKKYKTLNLTEEESKTLDIIKSVMHSYTEQASVVQGLWANGSTPAEIDKMVKINDTPAFEAFKILTERSAAISEAAHREMAQASRFQLIFLVASFLLLSAVIVGAVLIQRSQTSTIDSLSQTMTDIEQNRDFSRRIHDGRTDEVGALTSTFDKLLADIESMLALNRAVLDAVPDPIFLGKDGKVAFGNIGAANYEIGRAACREGGLRLV